MDRFCTDCGAPQTTVLVHTDSGDRLCRRCWSETTATAGVSAPYARKLEDHIAALEQREARAARRAA